MCKYKHSLTKIETSYIVAFLNGTNCRFIQILKIWTPPMLQRTMFSILNCALSWEITSIGNKFCRKKRLRLIKALDNRF